MIKVHLWGVRGSIPCPGPQTMLYGGNTSCYEIVFPEVNRRVILDTGSGIRDLGNALVEHAGDEPVRADIFLTHTHWDHIMGFPFFLPAYIPGAAITISGPVFRDDETLEDIVVGGQMKYKYFPVKMTDLAASISYRSLSAVDRMDLGDGISMSTFILNHPITALGYRFEFQGRVVCTAYDHEPFREGMGRNPAEPPLSAREAEEKTQALLEFFAGADLLLHDAQYTLDEYENGKQGWGHSPMEYAVEMAEKAGVRRLAMTHHDPRRTDAHLDRLTERYCRAGGPDRTEVFFAREGAVITLR